jgi:hypothetical protein
VIGYFYFFPATNTVTNATKSIVPNIVPAISLPFFIKSHETTRKKIAIKNPQISPKSESLLLPF